MKMKKMNEEIIEMLKEDEIIEEGLAYIKFEEWKMDELEKKILRVRFMQFGKFILEKYKKIKKN